MSPTIPSSYTHSHTIDHTYAMHHIDQPYAATYIQNPSHDGQHHTSHTQPKKHAKDSRLPKVSIPIKISISSFNFRSIEQRNALLALQHIDISTAKKKKLKKRLLIALDEPKLHNTIKRKGGWNKYTSHRILYIKKSTIQECRTSPDEVWEHDFISHKNSKIDKNYLYHRNREEAKSVKRLLIHSLDSDMRKMFSKIETFSITLYEYKKLRQHVLSMSIYPRSKTMMFPGKVLINNTNINHRTRAAHPAYMLAATTFFQAIDKIGLKKSYNHSSPLTEEQKTIVEKMTTGVYESWYKLEEDASKIFNHKNLYSFKRLIFQAAYNMEQAKVLPPVNSNFNDPNVLQHYEAAYQANPNKVTHIPLTKRPSKRKRQATPSTSDIIYTYTGSEQNDQPKQQSMQHEWISKDQALSTSKRELSKDELTALEALISLK